MACRRPLAFLMVLARKLAVEGTRARYVTRGIDARCGIDGQRTGLGIG